MIPCIESNQELISEFTTTRNVGIKKTPFVNISYEHSNLHVEILSKNTIFGSG